MNTHLIPLKSKYTHLGNARRAYGVFNNVFTHTQYEIYSPHDAFRSLCFFFPQKYTYFPFQHNVRMRLSRKVNTKVLNDAKNNILFKKTYLKIAEGFLLSTNSFDNLLENLLINYRHIFFAIIGCSSILLRNK